MTQGVLRSPARWRAFADAVALALGINVWISIIVLPGLFVGSFRTGADFGLAVLPLLALSMGLWRRSEVILLLLFPSALMVPVALSPALVGTHVYGPTRFVLVCLGLLAYLFGISFFTSFSEPAPPASIRPLASSREPIPPRWRRRLRMYRALTLLSAVFPATLLYTVNFDPATEAFLRQMFPGRAAQMTAVLDLAVIAAWVVLYLGCFLSVLRYHRTGDRALTVDLARTRADAARTRPRPVFYVGVLCALGLMLLLLAIRYIQ